jgi:hypothetical protein
LAKFEQNRFFRRGRLVFDFCGHPLLRVKKGRKKINLKKIERKS